MKKIILISFLVVSLAFVAACNNTPKANLDEFAKCITDEGTKFYGAYWCPHCQRNKEMFGDSIEYVDYIECAIPNSNQQNPVCDLAGVNAYPTWIFKDGEKYEGEITLEKLSTKTGCILPA